MDTKYLVLPFGIACAPAVLLSLVNDVLRDMLYKFIFVYLNYIFFADLETHKADVRQVLQWLLDNQLFVKAKKCELFQSSSVSFLGYVIAEGEIRMNPEKSELSSTGQSTLHANMYNTLRFANFYCKFIKNFISIAAPPIPMDFNLLLRSVLRTLEESHWWLHPCTFLSKKLSPGEKKKIWHLKSEIASNKSYIRRVATLATGN